MISFRIDWFGLLAFYLYLCYVPATAAAKSLQLCLTLHNPIDGSPPASSVPGILQARTLEWGAISFSNTCLQAKSLQLCPTLHNPIDGSPPGSSNHRILQARTLEWVAISFSMGWSNCPQNTLVDPHPQVLFLASHTPSRILYRGMSLSQP